MLVTEKEAKTKWCSEARVQGVSETVPGPFGTAHNRVTYERKLDGGKREIEHGVANGSRCIASECMKWRWSDVFPPANLDIRQGYCGLAGPAR